MNPTRLNAVGSAVKRMSLSGFLRRGSYQGPPYHIDQDGAVRQPWGFFHSLWTCGGDVGVANSGPLSISWIMNSWRKLSCNVEELGRLFAFAQQLQDGWRWKSTTLTGPLTWSHWSSSSDGSRKACLSGSSVTARRVPGSGLRTGGGPFGGGANDRRITPLHVFPLSLPPVCPYSPRPGPTEAGVSSPEARPVKLWGQPLSSPFVFVSSPQVADTNAAGAEGKPAPVC